MNRKGWHHKTEIASSARAMVIIDEKDIFIDEIRTVTRYRRFDGPVGKRTKWIAEFSFAVDSEKNTMIQISDLLLFLTRKFLEIENGYKETMPTSVKTIFRDFYRKVNDRMIYKRIQKESGRNANYYNNYINEISSLPSTRWNSKIY